jgi:hypothetical protein
MLHNPLLSRHITTDQSGATGVSPVPRQSLGQDTRGTHDFELYAVVVLTIAACLTTVVSAGSPKPVSPEADGVALRGSSDSITLEVTAGESDRMNTPVVFALPKQLAQCEHFSMTRADDGVSVAVQRLDETPAKIAWLIRDRIRAGQSRQYLLTPRDVAPKADPCVICKDDGRRLSLRVGGQPVLSYNHAVQAPPEGLDTCYQRSGYIHPLFSPSGRQVTDDFPPDHAHQHAIFFAWVNTTFQGRSVDFWNQKKAAGKVEHVGIGKTVSGPVFAEFNVELRHSDLTAPDVAVAVLEETWTVRAYNLTDFFLVDIESRQRCASADPLTINEFHYGAMAIRGNRQWYDAEMEAAIGKLFKSKASAELLAEVAVKRDYLTSEGETWVDGNGKRARWVEMHGQIDGKPAGVAILGHPANFRAPQPVRLHPQKPYFCFAPMVLGSFQIEPGTTYTSRYRCYVHDGQVDASATERVWYDYATPPGVEIVSRNEDL